MKISEYQILINNYIQNKYLPSIKNKKLREIIEYSLEGGKRLRSMIVLDISYNLTQKYLFDMAISIELLHTASLIIDDLPSMDNDNLRRGKPTVHTKFGEKAAKLVSYYLFYDSYNLLNKCSSSNSYKVIKEMCNQNMLASYGQFFDLFNEKLLNKNINVDKINLKTSPFFCIAFIGGYLLSGGNDKYLNILKKSAIAFSNFFQICDDFEDMDHDAQKNNNINQVLLFGKVTAKKLFYKNIETFNLSMSKLNLNTELMKEIVEYLINKLNKFD